jgi:hypothetical protein
MELSVVLPCLDEAGEWFRCMAGSLTLDDLRAES